MSCSFNCCRRRILGWCELADISGRCTNMVDGMYIYGYVDNESLIPGLKEVDVYAVTQASMSTGTIAHSSDLRKYRPPGSMYRGRATIRRLKWPSNTQIPSEPNFTSSNYPQNFKNGSWIRTINHTDYQHRPTDSKLTSTALRESKMNTIQPPTCIRTPPPHSLPPRSYLQHPRKLKPEPPFSVLVVPSVVVTSTPPTPPPPTNYCTPN
jgi:hypothetical protein